MKKTVLFLLPFMLFGHDIWIEKNEQGYQLNYGHLHPSSEHAGKKTIEYNPENIKEIVCEKEGKIEKIENTRSYPLVIKDKCDALFIYMDNGYFTKTPYGTKNLPKNEVKMALKSWRSFESVKRIEKNSKKSIGKGLEILLLNDVKKVGDKARLLILFDGRPVEGAVVAYDDKPRGQSGVDGRVNIRVKRSGLQNIKATLRKKCDDNRCDEVVYTTTLNIEVAE
ncbi:DUF4198 domain-containing protein [Nitrosophilus alvini]|uniref:DUF4198 domain-containing protein n=1 Tax=Nitrosophilus alvini TaxID=2714855 RepID=UPI00190AF336|nr:DUF4198 domain-containing protein [Nitrosophilus alvini]